MALDTSIYGNIQQVKAPDLLDSASKAMSLSQMALQNQQAQRTFAEQDALRQAIAKNANPDGTLNKQGVLSDLAKTNPNALMTMQQHFATQDKAQAEAQSSKADSLEKIHAAVLPGFQLLASLPPEQRAQAFPAVRQQWAQSGQDMQRVPTEYDPGWFGQSYSMLQNSVAGLNAQKSKSDIAKNWSEVGQAPAKLNADLYGSRSPNAELTSQYDKQAAPIRSSQLAMAQMHDNYLHPSPQGDASLVLNAFKIKFPTAPDVNSLEELTHSQAASDTFKNAAAKALQGGLDQATRDNLMRDGISTFRANVESLRGIQDKYNARAKQQNVNDPTLTAEPAVDKTFNNVMSLQDKIGPYVPPAERGGMMAGLAGLAGKALGIGGNQSSGNEVIQSANAATMPKHGTVEDGFVFMGGDPSNPKSWKRAK